uniref:C-type lectin domain-containing protein n=1 Tax=Panagrellus redivivus TaxID=6233 RepID=A0A7E4V988_PANRE
MLRPNMFGWALIVTTIAAGIYWHPQPKPVSCEDLNGMYTADSRQCFIVVDKPVTFHQAMSHCKSKFHRKLFVASVPTQPHNFYLSDWIRRNYPHINSYYIGVTAAYYSRQGFSNEDGSEMRYWPKDFKHEKHYCTMVDARTEEWREVDCERKLHFVCANKPVKDFVPSADLIIEAKVNRRHQSHQY